MPIEIRELIIKTTIVDNGLVNSPARPQALSKQDIEKLKKEILEFCIDKLDDKRNKQKER